MKHELLVPVGNWDSLVAAINNGADAVYLGGKKFGARAFAENFTLAEIEKATLLCHLYDVKIYVTVNTLIFESEIDEALNYIKDLHKIGVDAVIMQDVGLIDLVHRTLPNLEIHASTQMHIHSQESLRFLKNLGIKRVVFARELSLDYINNIETDLEKEVFIHGSLCISYSGQCLFSSLILNRSGNRGECAGMCRLPYKLKENDNYIATEGDYILSPKDLCSVNYFAKLMASNIYCFKIEGRMKSAAYVGIVTKIYRSLMDQYERRETLKVAEEDFNLLQAIFTRDYTEGFLNNNNDIMNYLAPNHQGIKIGKVTEITKKRIKIKLNHDLKQFEGIRFRESNKGINVNFMYDENDNLINMGHKGKSIYLDNFIDLQTNDEVMLTNPYVALPNKVIKKIPIKMEFTAHVDEPIEMSVADEYIKISTTDNYVATLAKSSPMTKERIAESLEKVGNTPFTITEINIDIDDNIFIPVGVLNNFRRDMLNKLQELRKHKKTYYEELYVEPTHQKQKITNEISVLARNEDQIKVLQELKIKNIIVEDPKLMQKGFIYRVPRDNLIHNYKYSRLLVTDYASLDKYPKQYSDYFLNITNHYTLDYLRKNQKKCMLSVECNMNNLKDIMDYYLDEANVEVLVYGNIELMLLKHCPLNSIINKDKECKVCSNGKKYYLVDRNQAKYPIINHTLNHSTTILSSKKYDFLDKLPELKKMGITNYRIELLDESKEEIIKIIERVKKIYE